MKKLSFPIIVITLAILASFSLNGYDFPHFYRASYFAGEPRLAKDKLTSFDALAAAGSTCESRDCAGSTVCLFDLHGLHNMQLLGSGVPDKDPSIAADLALIYLARQPARDAFAHLSFSGKFKLIETIVSYAQNFKRGFFLQAFVPIKRMKVCGIQCRDYSPIDDASPNVDNLYWQMFLNLFPDILQKYCLSICDWCETGIGDVSVLAGWACNYQETTVLDYIDMAIRLGFSIPSGRELCIDRVFDIAPGYDGHVGLPILMDGSLGLFEWLTLGAHIDALVFFDKTKMIRMKTDTCQCGMLKLAKGCATIKKGSIVDVDAYVKADHFARGLSILVGYTYSKKNRDTLCPQDSCTFDSQIVNTDQMLQGWDMHTMHFIAEYDFGKEGKRFSPRISGFYNYQFSGRRVFKNSMAGGSVGFDIAWDF